MGGLKTFLNACLVGGTLGFSPLSVSASPIPQDDPLRFFANCAGRLSAQMEHEWMFDGPKSELTKNRRNAVLEILEAMMPPNEGRTVLNWRIEAKHAQSALLTRATFNNDVSSAKRARRLAVTHIDSCGSLLLS